VFWGLGLGDEFGCQVIKALLDGCDDYSFFYYSFIHMCIHFLGHFSPLSPSPTLSPFYPQFQAGCILPLSLVLLKKRDKLNKEDKAN
jgi:hypothetical protein